jgi:uncharacterized Zn finger protein (UPF0148 family)
MFDDTTYIYSLYQWFVLSSTWTVAVLFDIDHLVSGMSDFDKEAEREKLRKQFEEDKKKRESTERMSELLLQGATMTNRHCDTCGDPIFRYEGQKFCPTCQVEIADEETAQTTAEQQQQRQQQQTQPSQSSPDANAASTTESETTSIEIDAEDSEANTQNATGAEPESGDTSPSPPSSRSPESEPKPESRPEPEPKSPVRSQSTQSPSTDLAEARQSLSRTVTRFAKQAEAADDLAYARTLLAATEDAADALEAVERLKK